MLAELENFWLCQDFRSLGFHVRLSNTTSSGKLLTLQVKTASKIAKNEKKYKWPTVVIGGNKRSDIYALVAYDTQKIFWVRGDSHIIKKWTTRLFPQDFEDEDELLKQVINSFER